jgi:uncharacterized membrane protein SpoIIM required for sporulation
VHHAIYVNKKEDRNRFVDFWRRELPLEMYKSRRELLYSLIIFAIAFITGAVSAAYDDTFVRLILGDAYVNQTLANIESGDPMGIYKSMDELTMFAMITFNNIRVSVLTFLWGGVNGFPLFLLVSFGTGLSLLFNGIMIGSFQYFFYQHDLLVTSLLTVWVHGTLEISAIIVAGGAGLVMGNAFLFPGTYSRLHSFMQGAKRGLKIIVGLIPVFITAGFLEGFVTRHTEWHWSIRLFIILTSLLFVVYYFIWYPRHLAKHQTPA